MPAALLTCFALVPQPPYGAEPFHDTWRRHLLVGLALLFWVVALAFRRRLPRLNLLLLPLVLLVGVLTAANFANSDWRVGVEPVLDLLSAVLVLDALADAPGLSAESLRRSLLLMALAVALVALHFVWQRWQDWLALVRAVPDSGSSWLPPTVPRVLGVGTNPNILAPLLTLCVPLFLYSLLRTGGLLRALTALALVIVQVAVFFTLSRAAWIGEAAGVGLAASGIALASRSYRLPLKPLVAVTCAGIVLAAALLAIVLARGERPLWLFRPSFSARSDFRAAALHMIARQPWLGAGPGRFPLIYPLISDGDPAGAVHSHNIPIQIAVEGGLIGLAAAALVAFSAGAVLWRVWKTADRSLRWLIACVAGSFASFAVGGMADALHLFPEILFVLAALMAVILRAGTSGGTGILPADADSARTPVRRPLTGVAPRRFPGSLSRTLALLPLLLSGLLLVAWLRIDQAGAHYGRSLDLASKQRWLDAATEAGRASSIDPGVAVYYVQRGLSLELEAETTGSADARGQAIDALERALQIEPRSSSTRLELAVTLAAGGREADAAALLPEIVHDAPRDPLTLLGAGVLDETIKPEDSVPIYARALAESPRIVDSAFWRENAFRQRHYQEIVARALVTAAREDSSAGPAATREIIADGAAVRIPGQGFVARVDLARWYIRQGDDLASSQILATAVRERPDDPAVRLALGELYAAQGNRSQARRQWLAGAYLGDTASIMALGGTFPPQAVPPVLQSLAAGSLQDLWVRQFSITQQHYRFAFRRQEPLPIVLRGDWLNALPLVYSQMTSALSQWRAAAGPSAGR